MKEVKHRRAKKILKSKYNKIKIIYIARMAVAYLEQLIKTQP